MDTKEDTKVTMEMDELNDLSRFVLDAAFKVHRALGPGLLENAYKECLAYELSQKGFKVEVEKPMPLHYDEILLQVGYRVDILVEDNLILEIKAVDAIKDVHKAQVLTYLKLSGCKLGLIINFNSTYLKHGIKRLIL